MCIKEKKKTKGFLPALQDNVLEFLALYNHLHAITLIYTYYAHILVYLYTYREVWVCVCVCSLSHVQLFENP